MFMFRKLTMIGWLANGAFLNTSSSSSVSGGGGRKGAPSSDGNGGRGGAASIFYIKKHVFSVFVTVVTLQKKKTCNMCCPLQKLSHWRLRNNNDNSLCTTLRLHQKNKQIIRLAFPPQKRKQHLPSSSMYSGMKRHCPKHVVDMHEKRCC